MNMRSDEPELRGLMVAGLDGDAAAHKALLTRLSANLRAYFKTHLARIGKGPADAEDLVQETLIALHDREVGLKRLDDILPIIGAVAEDYCRRCRPAARHAEPVDTSTSHVGFRCISVTTQRDGSSARGVSHERQA
jgi:RNA polymerase sigma-70 factor (ECF subfamily)